MPGDTPLQRLSIWDRSALSGTHPVAPFRGTWAHVEHMIPPLILIEDSGSWRAQVLTLAPGAFPNATEAALHVSRGEGGTATLPLWSGRVFQVDRGTVEAICGGEEGPAGQHPNLRSDHL